MPASKIDEQRLLEKLIEVFRLHGYEGASLSRISEATGLQRASLYHRFPGGKEDMADAVLAEADRLFVEHVLAPLQEPVLPATRVRRMAEQLATYYCGGRRGCLLDVLSLDDATPRLRKHVEKSFAAWLDVLEAVAAESGATPKEARRRAEEAILRIQGALVLARGTNDTAAFDRVLAALPGLVTKGQG